MKINLQIELEYDDEIMHGDDAEGKKWFYDEILTGKNGLLLLHSNNIGATVGKVKVINILPVG